MSVNQGFDFLLEHFNPDYLFPRTIMTKKLGKQITVYSKTESLKYFEDSEYIDCRINAFPFHIDYKGLQRYPPDFIFIDLDKADFKSDIDLQSALSKSLRKISKIFGAEPTVLWTGNGYHIYQPLESVILEQYDIFAKFQDPSKQFLRFAKDFMSSGKADISNNPSFKSCLLRIPYSINSKCLVQATNAQNHITNNQNKPCVKIIQKWDGHRPSIKYLLRDFLHYLINQEIKKRKKLKKEISKKAKYNQLLLPSLSSKSSFSRNKELTEIKWIEYLLEIPIADYRKHTISLILSSYLVNVKKMSYQESICILTDWLSRCNQVRQLDFDPDHLIGSSLKTAVNKEIPPMKLETLKNRNINLYQQVLSSLK